MYQNDALISISNILIECQVLLRYHQSMSQCIICATPLTGTQTKTCKSNTCKSAWKLMRNAALPSINKSCSNCGNLFPTVDRRNNYCSTTCKYAGAANTMKTLYGYENPAQKPRTEEAVKASRDKTKATNIIRYGVQSAKQNSWYAFHDFTCEKELAQGIYDYCLNNNLAPNSPRTLEHFGISTFMTGRILKRNGLGDILYKTTGSTQELEIEEFLVTLGIKVLTNQRPAFMSGLELDFLIPDSKIAIEHHGLVFHSERPLFKGQFKDLKKIKTVHAKKQKLAQVAGIRLIQFFEDEWSEKQSICKNMIINRLGLGTKIGARECTFNVLSVDLANSFFKEHHISGGTKASQAFGLFLKGELVSAISFRKTWNKSYGDSVLELARYASKGTLTVVGGLSKMLKHCEPLLDCHKILTYADLRFGTGEVYSKVGFIRLDDTDPNYFYEKGQKRVSRFSMRKDKNLPESTERAQRNVQGWYAIYDAGNACYLKTLT